MKIDTAYHPFNLIKTYIVESFKAGTQNLTNSMIRYQKVLLPSHENVFPLCAIFIVKIGFFGLLCKGPPRLESSPVLHVGLVCCAPAVVFGLKCVFRAYYLAFKVCRKCGMILRETWRDKCISQRLLMLCDSVLPSIRRYPHKNDSFISTCLISTSTLYF